MAEGCLLNDLAENPPATIILKYPKIEIRTLPNHHPAYCGGKGMGVFCRKTIQNNEIIGEYVGVCRTENEYRHSLPNAYILHHGGGLYIDAKAAGNELRFVNDYRGVSFEQNVKFFRAEPQSTRIFRNKTMKGYTAVVSCKLINPGEELLVDYGEKYCLDWGIS